MKRNIVHSPYQLFFIPGRDLSVLHPARVPLLLLAGHGKLCSEPCDLLPYECKVTNLTQTLWNTKSYRFRFYLKDILFSLFHIFSRVYRRNWYSDTSLNEGESRFGSRPHNPFTPQRRGVVMESKKVKADILAGRKIPHFENSSSTSFGCERRK